MKIGIVGSGAMGSGIAQVAAQAGHEVILSDQSDAVLLKSETQLKETLDKLVQKGKVDSAAAKSILSRIKRTTNNSDFADCGLVIEAIVENVDIKKSLFSSLDSIVTEECVLASNTSSLSITAIASASKNPARVMGIHFFNPAPLMPLVEIIPAMQSDLAHVKKMQDLITSWGKSVVLAKDTPGFIVNRVARPFYGEALRIYEEGMASFATIDTAMKELGGFRMGPFELMDLIGNDVNYAVTESVFRAMYYDQRYKPSITQLKMTEAGWLGRKSGRGYYSYSDPKDSSEDRNPDLENSIFERILVMLINEAYDAEYMGIASGSDIDLAMTKGVNYPKGLIEWGKEFGLQKVESILDSLNKKYGEDRYRCSPGIRNTVKL
jgi:3-hydroxybutyryl-CoA dehydrogenase